MTELQELEEIYCEMHKDVYGVKARWYKAESVEQARADLARLEQELSVEMERQRAAEFAAVAEFEQVLNQIMVSGARSREDAIRWLHDAHGTDGDDEYLAYKLGLPFRYFAKKEQA